MAKDNHPLMYPRRSIIRFICKMIFRFLLKLLFRIEVAGLDNFPKKGPLLIVGNHTGAMEVVLLNAYAPRQIEMFSAADMPAEKVTEVINSIYGSIPVKRGSYDRAALQKGLDVLKQAGMVGLFPEGGVWEVGKQRAQSGISWLSYRSGAPILPVGFNDTAGAMGAAFKFKRPWLKMYVGKVLPPASLPPGAAKKIYFQEHANQVMDTVYQLVPAEDTPPLLDITDESYDLEISISDNEGNPVVLPDAIKIIHRSELGRFFMLPHLLDIFLTNLELPVKPLMQLASDPPTDTLIAGINAVLIYLKTENPYLLTYRFGLPTGAGMQKGLEELIKVLEWGSEAGHQIKLRAIKRYFSIREGKEIIQREQVADDPWM